MATKVKLIADDAVGAAQIDSSASPQFTNLTLTGNLTVQGTTTTLDTTNLNVEDKNITLNYGTGDTSSGVDGAGITIQDAVDASNDATFNWSAANDRFVMSHGLQVTTGNVGIGTASPADTLHVITDSSTTDDTVDVARIEATSSGTPAVGFGPTIDFRGERGGASSDSMGRIGYVADIMTSSRIDGAFIVETAIDGTYSEHLRVTSAGNVGIGTNNPGQKLEVNGRIKLGGMILQNTSDGGSIGFNRNPADGAYIGNSSLRRFQLNGPGTSSGDYWEFQSYNSSGTHQGNIRIQDGKLGIGLTPSATLDVDGTVRLDGNYPNGTQNVAMGDGAFGNGSASNNVAIGHNASGSVTTSNFNVAIGSVALDAQTSGGRNVAIGYDALGADSTGGRSTAVGFGAFANQNFTGGQISYNVAVGYNAGLTNTTGTSNTAIGYGALELNTTGDTNTAVGKDSLNANTTGTNNTAVGARSLDANTTGTSNVAVGDNALGANVSGINNTAVGNEALAANTDNANTAIGMYALASNTSGTNGVAVGYNALGANTTAHNNTAMGYRALEACTTGTQNVAVGSNCMPDLTSGNYNIAMGQAALYSLTTGDSNTAIGDNAMQFGTTMNSCVAVGENAGRYMTGSGNVAIGATAMDASSCTGGNNVAVGFEAMSKLTSGGDNVAMGRAAALDLTSGTGNVAIGNEALENCSTASSNTCIGKQAGRNINANSNVCIGNGAAKNATSMDTSVVIGDDAGTSITSAGNNVIIGRSAGDDLTTGGQNVIIGKLNDAGSSGAVGRVVLGYSATGATNNSLTIGYGSTDSAFVMGNTGDWYAPSDERLKEEIQDETIGLAFINDLRPRTFRWKKRKDIAEELSWKYEDENPEERVMNGKYNHGFIAQEVKATLDNHNLKDGFGFWMQDDTAGNQQRVGGSELIPILVKAIQELKTELDAAKARIETLEG